MFNFLKKNSTETKQIPSLTTSPPLNPTSFPTVAQSLVHPENISDDEKKKNFSWQQYAQGDGMFQSEFGTNRVAIQILKKAYANDDLIQTGIETIAKQFLGCSFEVRNRQTKDTIINHPMARILHNPIKGDTGGFHFANIVEMYITGTSYCIWIPDEEGFRRLPTEAVTPEIDSKTGDIRRYKISTYTQEQGLMDEYVDPKDIWVSMMPNIFSRYVGLSAIISSSLPALANKYSLEFVLGFFLRGGNMAGIVALDKTDSSQISRLMLTIQQIMGTRRNMHSDKYLPKGATWVASGQKFSDVMIVDVIRQTRRLFNARLGIPPALVGDTEGVNYANAESQIKLFWENTIIPLQKLYCRSIENSVVGRKYLRDGEELIIDNKGVKYIDPFVDKLNEDHKLKEILTINERRTRLGFDRYEDENADVLNFQSAQVNPTRIPMSEMERLNPKKALKLSRLKKMKTKSLKDLVNLLEPTSAYMKLWKAECKRWIDAYASNPASKNEAMLIIAEGKEKFLKKLTIPLKSTMKKTYFIHLKSSTLAKKSFSHKSETPNVAQLLENLWARSELFMDGMCDAQASRNFDGYTDTATKAVYEHIEKMVTSNPEIDVKTLASSIRSIFGEAYEGQANTIAITELGSASSLGSSNYAQAISTITKTSRKQWYANNTNSPRHGTGTGLHEQWVEWSSEKQTGTLEDVTFSNGLRHPRDVRGSAKEAINCQCTVFFELGALR